MDEQRLNKKLAEWVGFRRGEHKHGYLRSPVENTFWYKPNSSFQIPKPPNFTQSLDACRKWLVQDNVSRIEFRYERVKLRCFLTVLNEGLFDTYIGESTDKTKLALALCLAIEKLLGKEGE